MQLPTERLYLQDGHALETEAAVVAIAGNAVAFDRTCFYPVGGGQPHDTGWIEIDAGERLEVSAVHADDAGVVWHELAVTPAPTSIGRRAALSVEPARRAALTRYHTVLHVLNTIAMQEYDGWITGAQIATDYARIDFKLDDFSAELRADLEGRVNEALARDYPVRSYYLSADEFAARTDLLRTLEARPPVYDGRVRVVAIEGFDAQCCGGTHVPSTHHIGRCSIFKSENKGRINKRLYVRLDREPG